MLLDSGCFINQYKLKVYIFIEPNATFGASKYIEILSSKDSAPDPAGGTFNLLHRSPDTSSAEFFWNQDF